MSPVELRLNVVDAELVHFTIQAFIAKADAETVERVLTLAGYNVAVHGDTLKNLARIASYIETVKNASL